MKNPEAGSKLVGILLITGVLAMSPAYGEQKKRPLSVDDELLVKNIGEVTMSPDGRLILYSVRELYWAENEYENRHFMYDAEERRSSRFIGEGGGENFRFSPDGRYIAFLRTPAGKKTGEDQEAAQLFIIRTTGGEAWQLTHHRGGLSKFEWMPGSASIVFLANEQESNEKEKERRLGDDAYFVDLAPNGKHASRYTNFWSVALNGGETERLTELSLIVGDFDISPDGNRIVFDARLDTRTNFPGDAELYLFSIRSQALTRLTDNKAPESNPIWSPDGRSIAYRAPDDEVFDLRAGYFWIMNAESKAVRRLDGQSTGELTGTTVWSADSKYLLYSELQGTDSNLYRLDVASGRAQPLTAAEGTLRALAFSKTTERMVYSYESFTVPPDLFVSAIGQDEREQVTDLNPWIEDSATLSDAEILTWTSKGSLQIEGVYYPSLLSASARSPMIVHIHGGPAGGIANAFHEDFQVFAGYGFAVLAPNFRGSTGYGDALLRGLMGEVGDGEFIDIMSGVDYAIAEREIDPGALAVRGWSWGGVSASYVITQTDRFKAASIGAMVGNWAAETGPGFNFDVALWYIGGTPWDHPEEWRKRSSITHVIKVTTPAILFHGGNDETSSVGQSLMYYTALRDIGKSPVQYMNFPREGHEIREPRHRRRLREEELRWFHRHVRKEDWQLSAPSFTEK